MARTAARLTIEDNCFNLGYLYIGKEDDDSYVVEHHMFRLVPLVNKIEIVFNYGMSRLIFGFRKGNVLLGTAHFDIRSNAEHIPTILQWATENNFNIIEEGNRPKSLDKYFA